MLFSEVLGELTQAAAVRVHAGDERTAVFDSLRDAAAWDALELRSPVTVRFGAQAWRLELGDLSPQRVAARSAGGVDW